MSPEPGNVLERRFPNRLDALSRVMEEVTRFIETRVVSARAAYLVNLAIEEMVTNILKYGYDDTALHEILLRLEIHPDGLILVIEDDGREFNPVAAPEPDVDRPTEQRVPGGLGIHLVRKLAEQMAYERQGGRNRLTVRIRS